MMLVRRVECWKLDVRHLGQMIGCRQTQMNDSDKSPRTADELASEQVSLKSNASWRSIEGLVSVGTEYHVVAVWLPPSITTATTL